MKLPPRFVWVLVGLVTLPLATLGLFAARLISDQQHLTRARTSDELQERLKPMAALVERRVQERAREFGALASRLPADAEGIRRELRATPSVGGALVVERRGRRLFPPLDGPTSDAERAFLSRTEPLWRDGGLAGLASGAGGSEGAAAAQGWHGFYHGGGLRLVFWRTRGERVVAIEWDRMQMLADLVAALPATTGDTPLALTTRTALLDAAGDVQYAWGGFEPAPHVPPAANLALAPPLGGFRLVLWAPPAMLTAPWLGSAAFGISLALGAVAIALIGLALYLARERTRELRLTSQRVAFVSQVSHELKTPLTNIQLYAEIVAADLDARDDEGTSRDRAHLAVIVAESQRLSRLITNVLTLTRGQQGRLRLHRTRGVVDEAIRDALTALSPSLAARGIALHFAAGAPRPVHFDADAVQQILANLLSNVEKYAASGKRAEIESCQSGAVTTVVVRDHGPGIPPKHWQRVFEPFQRLSDRLTDGVAGTGIGLDIARRLARLHGGDLRLIPTAAGAAFELTLATPPADEAGSPGEPALAGRAGDQEAP